MRIAIAFVCLFSIVTPVGMAQEPIAAQPAQVQIRSLTLIANELQPGDRLRIARSLRGKTCFPEEMQAVVQRDLRQLGYLDAEVDGPQFTATQKISSIPSVDVYIHASPGLQYRLKAVRFEGASAFPLDQLRNQFAAETGRVFNATAIGKGFERLMNLYKSKGYLNVGVIPKLERDELNHTISMTIGVDEGKPQLSSTTR
jgi:outer membrane translocation and assembly module TamA